VIDQIKKYALWIIIGAVVLLSLFFFNRESNQDEQASDEMEAILSSNETEGDNADIEEESGLVVVDIKGEVQEPGIYEMNGENRIYNAIEEAGGFTSEADDTQVNLAQRLQDEMIVLVPKQGEDPSEVANVDSVSNEGMVKINYATQEEIETLNGIGPSKAEAIIQYREENGMFKQPEDLLEISGIGDKTLENLREQIVIP